MSPPSTRRAPGAPRRSGAEVRALILTAADEAFRTQGFHGATTREIARRAGVGESLIYRHFGSKSGLFTTVALEPFRVFMADWAQTWTREAAESVDPRDVTRSFVEGLYTFAHANRELLVGLLAAETTEGASPYGELAEAANRTFTDGLGLMYDLLGDQTRARNLRGLDSEITVAAAAGSVLGLALFEGWLFRRDFPLPELDRRIDEVTEMLLHGISHREEPAR